MAEQEAEHRRAMETVIVNSGAAEVERQFNESKRGQICAVLITLSAIAAGTYLAMNGHEVSGGVIGVGGIGGIVTTFILGRSGSRTEHAQQEPNLPDSEAVRPKTNGKQKPKRQ